MRKGTVFTCQILLYACFILLPATLFGQTNGEYKLTLSFDRIINHGNSMGYIEFEFYASSQYLTNWRHGRIEEKSTGQAPPSITRYYRTSEKNVPDRIRIWSHKHTDPLIGPGKPFYADGTKSWNRYLPYVKMDFDSGDKGESFINKMTLMVHLELIPVSIKLYYYTGKAPGSASDLNLLPDDDYITLKATRGFVEATYKWQYQVAGENTWHDMPSTVKYSSEGMSVVTFRGKDIFGEEFNNIVGQNVYFRINAITDETRYEAYYNKIALRATYSTPHIVSHQITQESCHGFRDASIRVYLDRALQRNEALTYFINKDGGDDKVGFNVDALDAANSFTIPNLTAGEHFIQLRGSYNGRSTYSETNDHRLDKVWIAERPAIDHSIKEKKNVSCYAGHDGVIKLSAQGGTGKFTGVLTDQSGAVVQIQDFNKGDTQFTKLSAGSYKLRVQDSNGCVVETRDSIKLRQPDKAVFIEEISKISPLAHQSPDGAIQIAVSGGTPGYTVSFVRKSDGKEEVFDPTEFWSDDGQYIYRRSNIPGGEYTAIAKDMKYASWEKDDKQEPCGCRAELVITLPAPPPLSVEIEESRVISCHGSSNGELTAHGKGGVPITGAQLPYTYSWFKITEGASDLLPLHTDSIARNLAAGKYQVKLTDANNISVESDTFELTQPNPLSLTLATQPPSCKDGSGLITTTVTGGTAPYTYEWNKEGATEAELTIDEAGSYFVRVVDSRECFIRGSVDVTAPDAITIKPTITHPTCHDAENGAITLDLEGGTAPYSIQWKDDATITSMNRDKLAAGEYTAVVSDQFGCSLRYRVVLEQPDALVVKLDKGFTLCHGQSQKITAQSNDEDAAYQWWHNGWRQTETAKELLVTEAGRYQVLVTNKEGCTATDEVEIKTSNTDLPLDITAPTTVTVGASIHAVNISLVKADRLEWRLPESAVVTRQSDEGVVFSIPKPGVYEIQLIGYLNDCSTVITQRLEVLDEGAVVLPDGKEEQILQLLVTPNSVLF